MAPRSAEYEATVRPDAGSEDDTYARPEPWGQKDVSNEIHEQNKTKPISSASSHENGEIPAWKELLRNDRETSSRTEYVRRATVGGDVHAESSNGHLPASKPTSLGGDHERVREKTLKLSSEKILELTSSPQSLPLSPPLESSSIDRYAGESVNARKWNETLLPASKTLRDEFQEKDVEESKRLMESHNGIQLSPSVLPSQHLQRPPSAARTVSTPTLRRRHSASRGGNAARNASFTRAKQSKAAPPPLRFQDTRADRRLSELDDPEPSPMPPSMPIPPLSLPTYLQLELSSQRPSPLYIHRSVASEFPYESSRVKIERLLNFLLLPPQLEQTLWFGALACLDAWLYTFTILPLRFVKAVSILATSWGGNLAAEAGFLSAFIYAGLGRMWQRRRRAVEPPSSIPRSPKGQSSDTDTDKAYAASSLRESSIPTFDNREVGGKYRSSTSRRHRRTKSTPSALMPDHKADILKGLLIVLSCFILMYFDASRMYHGIRGQAAIKLYVIYNVLEVCDRLFSALGQDVLECLFSKETLERKPDGRSKIHRPFWLFVLALAYNLVHATALFYQVITLNVAVNSYSNALLTLLMSNQFVEIKSTVFKKFEKENLFQLTCADVVERFQLWLMLTIIASRNIIETGGVIINAADVSDSTSSASSGTGSGNLPKSFTFFPSMRGQVFGPFLLVLGSEMLVDWLKHAYITKFNNTKPAIYGRFLDVLTKDYYSNAFADQNLTKRLGLPVIPLACLFIRASVQNYHMFLATHMPLPAFSPSTSLTMSNDNPTSSPSLNSDASLNSFFRRALGRTHPRPLDPLSTSAPTGLAWWWTWTPDDLLTILTTTAFFALIYLVLLTLKLILGMFLLRVARHRYRSMKERERVVVHADGRRVGGWGVVEVDEDKRRWIYADDPEGSRRLREREREGKARAADARGFEGIERYSMVGKRIW